MYYEQIQGWFDFHDIYNMVVERVDIEETSMFVEVGCWRGKSFCYLCEKILESNKYIFVHAVDTWLGVEGTQAKLAKECGGHENIYQEFLEHRKNGGFEEFTNVIRKPSVEAAKEFKDGSLSFVFIDAFHEYESVKADILAWLPKLKLGSVIAGHDFNNPGVEKAVREILGSNLNLTGLSWWVQL